MILCIENPKYSTRKLLELTNELIKVLGYQINIHKSVPFLHTNNVGAEREFKESISFTIAPEAIRYLGIPKK